MGLYMYNMYERIEQLCQKNEISISALCRQLSLPRTTLSELKAGRTKSLSAKHCVAIAEYFGVSADYILGKSENLSPISDPLQKLITPPAGKCLYTIIQCGGDGQTHETIDIDEADVELVKKLLKAIQEKNNKNRD